MSRLWMLALVCACAMMTATPAFADERIQTELKPVKKDDALEAVLGVLTQEVQLPAGSINDIPLFEILQHLTKTHNQTFIINEAAFKQLGEPNAKEMKPTVSATQLRGLNLHQFLTVTLEGMGATYLVKNNAIEIVPVAFAAKLTKSAVNQEETGPGRLQEPLVSAIIREKPLNVAVAKIAEMYDLTVVLAPPAAEARMVGVSARLLNVPADKAIELLAQQANLRVVRQANAFLITSKEQAEELFAEKLEKERQLIELEKFRQAKPPMPGVPSAPQPLKR